uniref:Uncharacterized protein n=1 Tax=uncultured Thiotrichaceae bacterium TaxID=298394 RepID=A0A6S6T2Q4_9GAMM|nr:MAG: Unknown protein [uncultured Thiotrichaceae bacterium]
MSKRNGILIAVFLLAAWLTPVSADESADEIVAMMSWWDDYGRYWEEMGVESSLTQVDEEAAFAWLGNIFALAESDGSAQ